MAVQGRAARRWTRSREQDDEAHALAGLSGASRAARAREASVLLSRARNRPSPVAHAWP
jgi:hypothetical protein